MIVCSAYLGLIVVSKVSFGRHGLGLLLGRSRPVKGNDDLTLAARSNLM